MKYDKVENYYNQFDEWNRLSTPEGALEFRITLEVIGEYVKSGSRILDLGGGPGRYTIELAKKGYLMSLGDLSPVLIETARKNIEKLPNIESIEVVNAIDLSSYQDEMFDAVLFLGPLYHLVDRSDITKSLKEVNRVLKPEGRIIASFIPLLSGTIGIIERSIYAPSQVDASILEQTYIDGIFHNKSNHGFQEGKYLKTEEIEDIMTEVGFNKLIVRSVRGIGFKQEKGIAQKEVEDNKLFIKIMELIKRSSQDYAIVNTCGHALYIGEKFV